MLHRRFSPGTDLVNLHDLRVSCQRIFRPARVRLHDIQTYTNLNPELARHWEPSYRAREVINGEISINRLPPDSRVSGSLGFATLADGFLVAEQQPPAYSAMIPNVAHAFRAQKPSLRVTDEAMLIARFGEGTWGHWLVELLPKIAVCERMAPGRFKYVMADYVLRDSVMGDRVRESCAAYGVSEDRFIRLPSDEHYSFDRLHAMTPVFSGGSIHPQVKHVLNEGIVRASRGRTWPSRLNLLRSYAGRRLVNAELVNAELADRGFQAVEIAALSFLDQVAAFRSAKGLFSVLGSGLSGLVYSPEDAGVATAAPAEWGDDFFYGILRASRAARWAEVRGPVVDLHPEHYQSSSFQVDPRVLRAALDSLEL